MRAWPTPVTVRRLVPDDHEGLRALRLRALASAPDAYGSTYERELAFDDDTWRGRLAPTGNPHFVAVDADGRWLALAVGERDRDDPQGAFVLGVWTEPDARGTGVTEACVAAVEAWAAGWGATTLRLHVTAGNDFALRSYERQGFTLVGRSERRPRDGACEHEMVRPIRRSH